MYNLIFSDAKQIRS